MTRIETIPWRRTRVYVCLYHVSGVASFLHRMTAISVGAGVEHETFSYRSYVLPVTPVQDLKLLGFCYRTVGSAVNVANF
jgi:hypothetical protein